MSLADWIQHLISGDSVGCSWNHDSEGINFIFTENQYSKINLGKANDLLMHQHIALRMLVEQGEAEELPNGVLVPSAIIVQLDENARVLLDIPSVWQGTMRANIKGKTGGSLFQVELTTTNEGSAFTHGFSVEGPVISFSSEKYYILSPPQLLIFSALEKRVLKQSLNTE